MKMILTFGEFCTVSNMGMKLLEHVTAVVAQTKYGDELKVNNYIEEIEMFIKAGPGMSPNDISDMLIHASETINLFQTADLTFKYTPNLDDLNSGLIEYDINVDNVMNKWDNIMLKTRKFILANILPFNEVLNVIVDATESTISLVKLVLKERKMMKKLTNFYYGIIISMTSDK